MLRPLAAALILSLALALAACGGDDDGGGGPSTKYPDAGDDRFTNTHATVQIEITPEQSSIAARAGSALETIELDGPALVVRSAPRQDGDVFVVDTEIKEMTLEGTSSFGPVIVRESPDEESKGEVRQQKAGEDFPAESFFDVFVVVELPQLNMTLHNEEPLRMVSELTSLPPEKGEKYRGEDERPLYTPAGIAVGRIVDALHIPEPEPAPEGPKATTTTAATATPTTGPEPTATVVPSGATSKGGCVHGTGQSKLYIRFKGLKPGETISGTITAQPEGGLISAPAFTATADDQGSALAEFDIKRFGTYGWSAGGAEGSFTVEEVCPGIPQ